MEQSAIDEAKVPQVTVDEVNAGPSTSTQRDRSNSEIDSGSYKKFQAFCRHLASSFRTFLFRPVKQSLPTAVMSVQKDSYCYNMNHKNRGKCIIFNHMEFDSPALPKREGSAHDTARLEKTFGNLEFDIEIHDNLAYDQIMDVIKDVRKDNHTDNDCLCVIVLTHGLQNDLISAKDKEYKSDSLWKPFTADKCVKLAGKPKLFFIQACRGNEADSGVKMEALKMPMVQSGTVSETDTVSPYVIPTHADFLVAHSSVNGFISWNNPTEGSWYIQSLCDVLDKHGTEMDLMSMLTITAQKVAIDFASVHDNLPDKKQVPSATTTLTRFVYFPQKSVANS